MSDQTNMEKIKQLDWADEIVFEVIIGDKLAIMDMHSWKMFGEKAIVRLEPTKRELNVKGDYVAPADPKGVCADTVEVCAGWWKP